MSFSSETKNELARVKDIDVNDKQAELSAIVRMSGTIQFVGKNPSLSSSIPSFLRSFSAPFSLFTIKT